MRGDRGLLDRQNALGLAAVAIVASALVASIWIVTGQATDQQNRQALARAGTVVAGQVNILAEAVRQELRTVDQSLTILQAAWNSDPANFDLKSWESRMPALTEVADDIFIANSDRLIVQDILPQAVGQGVGADYLAGGGGSLEPVIAAFRSSREPGLVVGEHADNGVVRQYRMYMIRPLQKPEGWLIGASYRSAALVKVFAEGSLGARGLAALVDTRHGGVQAVAGPAALRPRLNLSGSAMYDTIEARKENAGTWIGPTAMDGEMRIHAYRRIPGRDLLVLAGVDEAEWMAPAHAWVSSARWLATLGSVLTLALAGLVLWGLWKWDTNRRRREALEQAAIQLNSAQSVLEAARLAAQASMAQVRAMLEASSDGIALFDADWRLAAWNPPFAAGAGLDAAALTGGLPVDELFRRQGRAGMFGPPERIEPEISRRLAQLRGNMELAAFRQEGPDGRRLTIHGCRTPDGGMMLIITGAPGILSQAAGMAELAEEDPELTRERPVEW